MVVTPRAYLACAIPAFFLVLTYYWFKNQRYKKCVKDDENPVPQDVVGETEDRETLPEYNDNYSGIIEESICSVDDATTFVEDSGIVYEPPLNKSENQSLQEVPSDCTTTDRVCDDEATPSVKCGDDLCPDETAFNSDASTADNDECCKNVNLSDTCGEPLLGKTLILENLCAVNESNNKVIEKPADESNFDLFAESPSKGSHPSVDEERLQTDVVAVIDEKSTDVVIDNANLSDNDAKTVAQEKDEDVDTASKDTVAAMDVTAFSSSAKEEDVDGAVVNDKCSEVLVNTQTGCSDVLSEGSSDSGKGGSEIHPGIDSSNNNSHTNSPLNGDPPLKYEFEIPQDLCGRLIGKHGKQISQVRHKSRCKVFIQKIPFNSETQVCVVEGLQSEIDVALEEIRNLFPIKRYPVVTLAQVNLPVIPGVSVPQTIQLNLPDGIVCDVILSSMVNAGHFFVQQPTHPSYPSLNRLDQCMLACYSQLDTPTLPKPIEAGMICVAPMMAGWYRAQIMYVNGDTKECDIKFVDYGGYSQVNFTALRQIRSDFMALPFQGVECYLANVCPKDESEGWSLEACATFEELAQGQILQSQIIGYAEDGVPCVHLYRIQGISNVFINKELVDRGAAKWIEQQT